MSEEVSKIMAFRLQLQQTLPAPTSVILRLVLWISFSRKRCLASSLEGSSSPPTIVWRMKEGGREEQEGGRKEQGEGGRSRGREGGQVEGREERLLLLKASPPHAHCSLQEIQGKLILNRE